MTWLFTQQKERSKYFLVFSFFLSLFLFACKEKPAEVKSTQTEKKNKPSYALDSKEAPPDGNWIGYYKSGKKKTEGVYKYGEREGIWTSWYENGIVWSEGEYRAGKKDGITKSYYPNGYLRYEGEYKMDERSGTWTFYDEEGKVLKKEEIK